MIILSSLHELVLMLFNIFFICIVSHILLYQLSLSTICRYPCIVIRFLLYQK